MPDEVGWANQCTQHNYLSQSFSSYLSAPRKNTVLLTVVNNIECIPKSKIKPNLEALFQSCTATTHVTADSVGNILTSPLDEEEKRRE